MFTGKTAAALLFMGLCGLSRVDGQVLQGRVLDAVSGEPLSGVSLTLDETTYGTATAANGTFTLALTHVPAVLVVSHLAYKTLRIEVFNRADSSLVLELEPSSYWLPAVNIQPPAPVEVMAESGFEVIDFEFLGDQLLLLANSGGNMFNPCLVLAGLNGDKINDLPIKRPGKLYRQVDGEIVLLDASSAYGIRAENGLLQLDYLMDAKEYQQTWPLVADREDPYWMLQQYSMQRLKLSYYRYNEQDSSLQLFCSVTDKPALDRLTRGVYFDGTEADWYFATHIMNKPVVAPIFRVQDNFLLFNFCDHQLAWYSQSGELQRRIEADFMKDRYLKQAIHRDIVSGDFYALAEKNGRSTIYRISEDYGTATRVADVPDFVFIGKFLLRGGVAWFLYKDVGREGMKKIYRLPL